MTQGSYRLFLDTAEVEAWRRFAPIGLFHGVTTNPTLLIRANMPCQEDTLARLVAEAAGLGFAEIHLQSWGGTAEALRERGLRLAALDPQRVVVKVPAVPPGFAAAARLIAAGARVTMTAVYSPAQALAATVVGAAYAAPYFGRLSDAGRDAAAVIGAMRAVLRVGGDRTRLLVASLRASSQVADLAAAGCDTFTIAEPVAASLLQDEASFAAAADFEGAATSA
jgi:transaldolase